MKGHRIAFGLLMGMFFLSAHSFAQHEKHCYTTEVYHTLVKDHPEIASRRDALEKYTHSYKDASAAGQVYIIPIVFHIVHNNGGENISDTQVEDQVRILNDDYRKRSYDTASIIDAFKPIAADCKIEFRLATIDPNGNCTNGIEHIVSPLTNNADDNAKLDPWPDDQYLNVWTVASLAFEGAAAYAYYPGTAPPGADGVIMLSSYVGSIGSSVLSQSRVLTHEVGHYLNLSHVWGDTNDPGVACGDDNVFDTPVTRGWASCNINGATCGNLIDNVQNYMEYSYCCKMFTEGQGTRMRAALNSPVGGRDNLWSSSNLVLTGTDGSATQVCVPVADFNSRYQTYCAGSFVQFNDLSWNAHPTSWNWNFPGGNPSSSPDSAPVIQYNTPGVYNVSLTSGNATGSNSVTKNLYIRINGTVTQPVPFTESFESPASFPGTDGYILNPDGGNTWQRVTNAGSTGTASIMINNFSGNPASMIDEFISVPVGLTNISSPHLTFKVAYAQRNSSSSDVLKVYESIDCGQTWVLRYTKSGSTLATAGISPGNFIPDPSQWRLENVNVPFSNHQNVRFKFQNISGSGNNIYIDDINVTGTATGIENVFASTLNFEIFPNPSNTVSNISFSLLKSEKTEVKITDITGREIKMIVKDFLPAGIYEYVTDMQDFSKGIYFINLKAGELSIIKKLVVQ